MRSNIKKMKNVSSDRFENTDSDNWLTCRLRITQVSFFILHIRLGLFWHGDRERERSTTTAKADNDRNANSLEINVISN